ncbi:MAG: hypothetical protein ACJAX4_002778 [Clostridium sp.]
MLVIKCKDSRVYEEYSAATPMMLTFGLDRAKSIEGQLNGTQPSTTYGTLATTVDLSTLGGKGKAGGDNKGIEENNLDRICFHRWCRGDSGNGVNSVKIK